MVRRTNLAATKTCGTHSVPDLMSRLREAEIRARIQQARKQAHLTQEQIADKLPGQTPGKPLSKRQYQDYEADTGAKARVPWSDLNLIAEVTGSSVEWILFGEDYAMAQRLKQIEADLTWIRERVPAEPLSEDFLRQLHQVIGLATAFMNPPPPATGPQKPPEPPPRPAEDEPTGT